MEQEWANALEANSTVKVNITPNYTGNSVRPSSINVDYWIDGEKVGGYQTHRKVVYKWKINFPKDGTYSRRLLDKYLNTI